MKLHVQVKQAGKKKQKIGTMTVALEQTPGTIEELLTETVRENVKAFRQRARRDPEGPAGVTEVSGPGRAGGPGAPGEADILAAEGKIGFGFLTGNTDVSEEEAVRNALEAFEDGLVAVFVDGQRYEGLQDRLHLQGGETVTFVRLTMLAGRMW